VAKRKTGMVIVSPDQMPPLGFETSVFWRSYDEIGKKSADLCSICRSHGVSQLQLGPMLWWRELQHSCRSCTSEWLRMQLHSDENCETHGQRKARSHSLSNSQ
jgi:hypothetical protein